VRLSVNVDHVATLRNARGGAHPDPVAAAKLCLEAGADGITVHLREDRRHIRDADLWRLAEVPGLRLNFEMAGTEEMVGIALKLHDAFPLAACCIVPEKRAELTTEGGLDIAAAGPRLAEHVARLAAAGIEVSLFVEPDAAALRLARDAGAQAVELHTGTYADAPEAARPRELARLVAASAEAARLGLLVHVGHGLNLDNLAPVAAIAEVEEASIGHALVGQAIYEGLPSVVRRFREVIAAARAASSAASRP
jgi:pyridoxine 5-phosphate synthase